jgi:hypothetical protein
VETQEKVNTHETNDAPETVETESMQSSLAVMSDTTDPKIEVSSEEGSYDVIKHKGFTSAL